MPSNPTIAFNVADYMQSKGLKLVGAQGNMLTAQDANGEEQQFEFNPQEYIASKGLKPEDVKVEVNSITTALPESPIGLVDRAKMALGNTTGSINYLKKTYGQGGVSYDKNKGIVVNDKGVWKQVDPNLMAGDRWDISEAIADIVEGAASETLPIAGSVGGATLAGAAGLPAGPGAIALAAAGGGVGAMAGRSANMLLGSYFGTFDATSKEMAEDLGTEFLLGAGGELAGVAARPVISQLVKATKGIGKAIAKGAQATTRKVASPEVIESTKDIIASTVGTVNNTGQTATRLMMDNTEEVVARSAKFGKDTDAMLSAFKKGESVLDMGQKALPKMYGETLADTKLAAAAMDVSLDTGAMAKETLKELIEGGFGSLNKKGKFIRLTPQDSARLSASGKVPPVMDNETFSKVKSVADMLVNESNISKAKSIKSINELADMLVNGTNKLGPLRGGIAIEKIANLNSAISNALGDMPVGSVAGRAKAIVASKMRNISREQLSKHVLPKEMALAKGLPEGSTLATLYDKGGEVYQKYANTVGLMRKMLNRDTGPDQFVTSLLANTSSRFRNEGITKTIIELTGERGAKAIQDMLLDATAAKYIPIVSRQFGAKQMGAAFLTGGTSLLAASPRGTAKALALAKKLGSSGSDVAQKAGPKVRATFENLPPIGQYAKQLNNSIATLTPKARELWLSNPNLVRASVQTALRGYMTEQQQTQELVKRGGI